jgi:hypothetical protein
VGDEALALITQHLMTALIFSAPALLQMNGYIHGK